jgi:hypothetical protein
MRKGACFAAEVTVAQRHFTWGHSFSLSLYSSMRVSGPILALTSIHTSEFPVLSKANLSRKTQSLFDFNFPSEIFAPAFASKAAIRESSHAALRRIA